MMNGEPFRRPRDDRSLEPSFAAILLQSFCIIVDQHFLNNFQIRNFAVDELVIDLGFDRPNDQQYSGADEE